MSEQSSGPFKNQDWGLRFRDKWACQVTVDCVKSNARAIAAFIQPYLAGDAGGDLGGTYPDPRVSRIVADPTSTFMWVGYVMYMRDVNTDLWHTVFLDSLETPGNPQFVIGNTGYTYAFLTAGL